ncbi:hypothetical protein DERP_005408 [Dermatophagoides pteronyssinus]|uniref:Uncharacterized protein n=1 Tax=Dermatophagoides pteronyssinus TaxID=6956 RepID=A0ABQ8JMH8_DERPT|nr:hypothetical protein DERP_005408 [Dermatophagoides pteronyssinus]
MEIFILFFF